jgi:hypothetical protein
MTLYEKCVLCHEEQFKYIMKQPCPKCKTIFFCNSCLDSYFKQCSTSCCQCKTRNIEAYHTIHMIYSDYVMMLFNIFIYYYSTNQLQTFILCANYSLCISMLLRLIMFDVRLLDCFNIITNFLLCLFVTNDVHILQMTYMFYIVVYIVQKI